MAENYPIVHVLYNRPSARRTAYQFYISHKDDIERHYENHMMNKIILKDGTVQFFMAKNDYKDWCRGRTYRTPVGHLMHSGTFIKEEPDERREILQPRE